MLNAIWSEWRRCRPAHLAAGLAYYALFAAAPLLVIATWAADFVFDHETAHRRVINAAMQVLGPEGGRAVAAAADRIRANTFGTLFTTIAGVILLIGALRAFW